MKRSAMIEDSVLQRANQHARPFLNTLADRPVATPVPVETLRSLAMPLRAAGADPVEVIDDLVSAADPGLVASAGPRYFGFVIGGGLPVALAADWLTSAWDQNAGLYVSSPAAAVIEEVVASWLLDVLGLPTTSSVGFVTGAMMANFTTLAAARHEVLARVGWDVEERGLIGAPPVHVVIGEEAHVTINRSLGLLGLGRSRVTRVPADDQGRMRAGPLREALASSVGPTIVCAQAGNVNTGAFDPFVEIADAVREHGGWLHVDGAFGLWAATSLRLRHLTSGINRADSWALDAHKWLNVPYDNAIAVVAHPSSHQAAMSITAAYLVRAAGAGRDPSEWVPEVSRRARGVTIYAALRTLGRRGMADLVERNCALAGQMADTLRHTPGIEILNEVVLNQVLVRFHPRVTGDADALTRAVIAGVQQDGTCWAGGTTWHGLVAMRISVSGWSTTREDIARSAAAIATAFAQERERGGVS
jgi:glutamate/tyrosine decarboxylase-like PLP-dependent enzyme